MAELENGQSLASRFTLIRQLGRGGMGEVWLARDENLGTQVVTKIVGPGATAEQISLLRQECRNARRLSHPNIVRVFDFHEDPSAFFISMEYVEGGDIAALEGREPKKIVAVLLPLVKALEYAHAEGVVHRDLKSGNVLMDGAGRPRLSDFGIAGVLEPDAADLLLSGGGSRNHASPQQMAGEPASPADDIYGLGALMTGLLSSSARVPEALRSLVQSMSAPAAADRPADMTTVRRALEAMVDLGAEEGTVAPEVVRREIRLSPPPRVTRVRASEPMVAPPPARRNQEPASRHPYWWLTVTVFFALAAVALGVFVLLPKWVDERESSPVVKASVEEPAPALVAPEPEVSEIRPQPELSAAEKESVLAESMAATPAPTAVQPVVTAEKPRPKRTRPVSPPAARVDPKAAEFGEAMSAGLRAFESGDLETAKGAFERALSLAPESTEAADGLARAELASRLEAIRLHQAKAEVLEGEERWRDAEKEYATALALDSTLRFAREGRNRAVERAALHDRLEYHIANPDRLSEESVLEAAKGVLTSARAIEPTTQKLQGQIDRLQSAIKTATTPVRVVLVSDNLTNVVVYRVGRLGTFEKRNLDLRPGTYTVVGTREGYRDVRRRLQVAPEGENEPLQVSCEEEI